MFREILKVLRREDLLEQAMEEAQEMLSKVEVMFKAAVYRVMECKEPDLDIYHIVEFLPLSSRMVLLCIIVKRLIDRF